MREDVRSSRCHPGDSRSIALAPVGTDGELDASTPAREWNARVSPTCRRAHCSALRVRILEYLENSIASASIYKSSYEGLTVDALAPGADEGRVRLRKAAGSRREGFDPQVSEWGNPAGVMPSHPCLNT